MTEEHAEQHEQLEHRQQQEEEVEVDESLLDTNSGDEAEEKRSMSVPDLTDSEAEVISMKTATGPNKDIAPRLSLGSDYRTVQAARDAASCVRHVGLSTEPRMERTKEEMRELRMEHGAKKLVAVVGGSHAG